MNFMIDLYAGIIESNDYSLVFQNSSFEDGNLVLTSHRMIWTDNRDEKSCLSLDLSYITSLGEEPASFTKR